MAIGKVSFNGQTLVDAWEKYRGYRLVDGQPEFDQSLWESYEEELRAAETAEGNRIAVYKLKQKLAETDYIAAKLAEGAATREEYAEELAQRKAWRDEISRLEYELK